MTYQPGLAAQPPVLRVHTAVLGHPLELATLLAFVGDAGAGATAVFLGTVRNTNDGRAVTGIEYQAYSAMAQRELRAIAEETATRFATQAIAVEHRVGYLALGEVSIAIAASHARRGQAFDAARYAIEEIKRRVPIWKREHYADGSRRWVEAMAHAAPAVGAQSIGVSA
jgi:molybdopterin synthase catalytic subunit